MGWQNCGSVNEPWATLDTMNKSWIVPVGERASKNGFRWSNDIYSKAVDDMGVLPLGDKKIDDLFLVAYEQYLKGTAEHPDNPGQEADSVRSDLLDKLADRQEQVRTVMDMVAEFLRYPGRH